MRVYAAVLVAVSVVACGKGDSEPSSVASTASPRERLAATDRLFRGAQLYQENCAQCHGPEAQGHPDWQNRNVVAAPPLNGTGKEARLRKSEMIGIIRNGLTRDRLPTMPAWKGRLSDQDIEDIIAWYQALWTPETYERWRKAETSDRRPRG